MNNQSDSSPDTHAYDYDTISEGYYDEVFRRKKGIQSKWHDIEYTRVGREIPAGASHLDIACGPGTFISTLPKNVRSIGVDIALPQIEYARKKYGTENKTFEGMEPGTLSFPDESFDVVTSTELIEHITEDEGSRLLKECMRVLKKGGRLVVTTPNYASGWPILEWIVNRVAPVSYEHQHITKYKKSSLVKFLKDSGFEIIDVHAFMLSAPFWAALSWKFADWVDAHEPKFLSRNLGNLLIGVARKP